MALHKLSSDRILALLQNLEEDQSEDELEVGTVNSDSEFESNFLNNDSNSSTDDNENVGATENANWQLIGNIVKRGRGQRGHGRGRARTSSTHANIDISTSNSGSTSTSTSIGAEKYTSPSGIVWTVQSQSLSSGRAPKHNVFTLTPGPTPYTKRRVGMNVASSWRLFVDESMLKHIQKCTQEEAHRKGNESWQLTLEDLDAFIGLLYARGVLGHNTLCADDMWNTKWGPAIFKETMSRQRFRELMRYLRFDVRSTRSERLITDKFALISEIWNKFIENCHLCYVPGPEVTVDEQLLPCKARCRFIQFMQNKPDKFGIKFWIAVDLRSKYLINGYAYLGKDERPRNQSLGESVVLKLLDSYLDKGRNVTTDNFFTTLNLAETLLSRQTTLVGTIRQNRRELPPLVHDTSTARFSTTVMKKDKTTLTIYRCKPRKNVAIMSTMHSSVSISEGEKKKPETVEYYNSTKCGVDVVDQMTRKYTTRCASRRWPIHVFYNLLDLSAINAWIIYKECCGSNISRRSFILKLVEELITTKSQSNKTNQAKESSKILPTKRKKCHFELCKKNNKTSDTCVICEHPVCGKCAGRVIKSVYCQKCIENAN